jgi:hypothetical protein
MIMRQADLSATASMIGDEEFNFDNAVIKSVAYRRVFMKQRNKLQTQIPDDNNEDDDNQSLTDTSQYFLYTELP